MLKSFQAKATARNKGRVGKVCRKQQDVDAGRHGAARVS